MTTKYAVQVAFYDGRLELKDEIEVTGFAEAYLHALEILVKHQAAYGNGEIIAVAPAEKMLVVCEICCEEFPHRETIYIESQGETFCQDCHVEWERKQPAGI